MICSVCLSVCLWMFTSNRISRLLPEAKLETMKKKRKIGKEFEKCCCVCCTFFPLVFFFSFYFKTFTSQVLLSISNKQNWHVFKKKKTISSITICSYARLGPFDFFTTTKNVFFFQTHLPDSFSASIFLTKGICYSCDIGLRHTILCRVLFRMPCVYVCIVCVCVCVRVEIRVTRHLQELLWGKCFFFNVRFIIDITDGRNTFLWPTSLFSFILVSLRLLV